jgi:hypothetical protein
LILSRMGTPWELCRTDLFRAIITDVLKMHVNRNQQGAALAFDNLTSHTIGATASNS